MLRITHSQIYWSSFWISIWRIKQSKHPICLRLPFSISQVSSAFLSCRYKIYVEENSSTEYNLKILQSSGLFTTEMLSLPFHTPTFDQYHHYIEQFVVPTVYWDVLYGWNSCQDQRKHLNNKRQPTQPHPKYSDTNLLSYPRPPPPKLFSHPPPNQTISTIPWRLQCMDSPSTTKKPRKETTTSPSVTPTPSVPVLEVSLGSHNRWSPHVALLHSWVNQLPLHFNVNNIKDELMTRINEFSR